MTKHAKHTPVTEAITPGPIRTGPLPPTELPLEVQAQAYELLTEFRQHGDIGAFLADAPASTVLSAADLPEIKRLLSPFAADSRVAEFLAR